MTTHRQNRRERGASLVEFAIVLPLFLILIGGMVDLGRAFYTEVMATNAAREGARAAMYGNAPGPRATAGAAGLTNPTVAGSACASGSTDATKVTVTVPFQWIILGPAMNMFGAGSALPHTISGEATMQCGG